MSTKLKQIMKTILLADFIQIPFDDPVAFTFFTGYMAMPGGWLGPDGAGLLTVKSMDLIYNIGDAVNKIGFGFVVYTIAMNESSKQKKMVGSTQTVS